jgi:hypothetical protein
MARQSEFTQEKADAICERLADGESLRTICLGDDMPSQPAVFRWLAANDTFRKQYAHARETQADAIFDEILDIADEATDDVQRSRLRVDARKWMAGKLKPKVYGDKVDLTHKGAVGVYLTKEDADL